MSPTSSGPENSPFPYEVEDVRTASQMALVAQALTGPVPDTKEDIAAFRPIEDKKQKVFIAERMRDRLVEHRRRLAQEIRTGSGAALGHHLLRALSERDVFELARLGLDTTQSWLDDILAALVSGGPFVDIDVIGLHATYHLEAEELHFDVAHMPSEERAGLQLGALFRDVLRDCKNVRLIVVADEVRDYVSGKELTDAQRHEYIVEVGKVLADSGVILLGDEAGKNYLIIQASELRRRVDQLISALHGSGRGVIETCDNGDVVFRPSESFLRQLTMTSDGRRQEFKDPVIVLKRHGEPTSDALEASSFLGQTNRDIVHVVIRDTAAAGQRRRVAVLLRAISAVSPDRYHDLLYSSTLLTPECLTYAICDLLIRSLENLLRTLLLYRDWEDFDPEEYAERNQGILYPHDRKIIEAVIEHFEHTKLDSNTVLKVAEVGSGPNLYPAMLLAPWMGPGGEISLIEYADVNRKRLKRDLQFTDSHPMWQKFEDVMIEVGGSRYVNVWQRTQQCANVQAGSVFDLPADTFDIVSAQFVAESITTSRHEFGEGLRKLAASVKKGGTLFTGHMIGSLGWYAGQDKRFPALRLEFEDIEAAYSELPLDFTIHVVSDDSSEKTRAGYGGMVIVLSRHIDID